LRWDKAQSTPCRCSKGKKFTKRIIAIFILAVGGGSTIDAAKAMAAGVFATMAT
jgi:alcohol dehydrogenase YqhD (iron-dependent ADH family)